LICSFAKGKIRLLLNALRDINKPIGILEYETKITEFLLDELKLLSTEEIEPEL